VDDKGKVQSDYLPDVEIEKIGGKIESVSTEGVLGKGGKRTVKFEWGGKNRTVIEYAEDASKFTPDEIKSGASFVVIKAPTPFNRGKEEFPEWILGKEGKINILNNLATGGFIHIQPTMILPPETLGFTTLIQYKPPEPQENRLVDQYENGYPLYQRSVKEPQFSQLLNLDQNLFEAILTRDGAYVLEINEKTLQYYEDYLKNVRKLFESIHPNKRKELVPILKSLLNPEVASDESVKRILRYGKKFGIDSQQKVDEYFLQTKAEVLKLFPELK